MRHCRVGPRCSRCRRSSIPSLKTEIPSHMSLSSMNEDGSTLLLDPPDITEMKIRPAGWEHAPAIIEIIRSSASWYEEFVDPEDLSEHWVDRDWARENLEKRDFYVGLLDDEVVGTISLQSAGEDAVYLGYIYLHTDHVGNGYGGDLMDFARSESRRRGRSEMVLIAHPEAEWAQRAYLKYGFQIITETRDEVLAWNDGWLEPYYEEGFQLYRYEL